MTIILIILITAVLSGIVTLVKLPQDSNAQSLMLITSLGIVTLFRFFSQSYKALHIIISPESFTRLSHP